MRAVLDPNVLIAALLSRSGAPAQIVSRWLRGEFELVVSDKLLVELERALAYPKLRRRVADEDAESFVDLLRRGARPAPDPKGPLARRSADPGDDYLLVLAEAERAVLVSGDQHLLALAAELPVQTPGAFLDALAETQPVSAPGDVVSAAYDRSIIVRASWLGARIGCPMSERREGLDGCALGQVRAFPGSLTELRGRDESNSETGVDAGETR